MTRSKSGFGAVKLGYRGNNSRIDKILKQGKNHYKLSSAVKAQRYQHTIGVYRNSGLVMMKFVLVDRKDEEQYWKLANKADRVNLDEESSQIKVYRNGKCKKFPIELW